MDIQNIMNTSISHTRLIIGAALLFVGAIIGVCIDPYLPAAVSPAAKSHEIGYQSGYQVGFDAAKSLVENSSLGKELKNPANTNTVSGTVTAIEGSTLTVQTESSNPFADPALATRAVSTNEATTVFKIVKKDAEQGIDSEAKLTPPQLVTVGVNVTDIKVGDVVTVASSGGIDTKKEFTAQFIQIMMKPTP